MPRKKITLSDLATELGLTIQTVSKALRGLPGMSEQTRSEVLALARRKGYRTKEQHQSLYVDKIAPYPLARRRFVLVQNEQSLNFNRLLLQGLHERFMEFGHTVEPLLLPPDLKPSGFAEWSERAGLPYAEGVFIAPRMGHDLLEQLLLSLPNPRILLNFPPPEAKVDSVIWDVYEAMHQAVRHLARLGHTRMLYIGETESQRGFVLRAQAFAEAMKEAGLQLLPDGLGAMQPDEPDRLLAERLRSIFAAWHPTALLCGIDEDAPRLVRALRAIGVGVPQHCSLVALLNEQTDELPLLSRPLLLIKETGYRAADRMLWRIANPRLPYEHIRVRGDFFVGATTQRAP